MKCLTFKTLRWKLKRLGQTHPQTGSGQGNGGEAASLEMGISSDQNGKRKETLLKENRTYKE